MAERDVRTLLFCKISPTDEHSVFPKKNHSEIYKELCSQEITHAGSVNSHKEDHRVFFAFGGYDALITYKPKLSRGSTWLHDIYKDKQRIIRSNSPNVVYHQMHLISNFGGNKGFWDSSESAYPFFLTTLVYGVRRPEPNEKINTDESSQYEHVIRKHIRQKQLEASTNFSFAVYNGISISDVVILWRARDIGEIMDVISTIEYSGAARKTITTLCFPLDENGNIDNKVLKRLESMKAKPRGLGKQRDMQTDQHTLHLSIHGSIRNRRLFDELYHEMCTGTPSSYLGKKKDAFRVFSSESKHSLSLGKNDFIISAEVDGPTVAKLAHFYYIRHDQLSTACWEILTDFRKTDTNSIGKKAKRSRPPSSIMSNIYKEYLDNYSCLDRYAWADTMLELLGTHYYIDQHPVMHGPSYLVYDIFKIANNYFFRKVSDFTSDNILISMLHRSEKRILNYIHNLDQLTEQITRNDDAMLNTRSNSHSIHFSIPESALDFYHAFLRQIVDYIVEYDRKAGLMPDGFEYDFLLTPKISTRFRFSHVFTTSLSYRSEDAKKVQKIWPEKQAYVLELPVESVFNPLAVFIPVVHECFHCFGDSLRMRELRRQCMAGFIATTIMNAAGCQHPTYKKATVQLTKMIYYGQEYSGNNKPEVSDFYLEPSVRELSVNTYHALGREGLLRLYKCTNEEYPSLYSDHVLNYWTNAQNKFYRTSDKAAIIHADETSTIMETVIEQCKYYFMECYADSMTIALLKLTPREYLDQIASETNRHYEEHQTLSAMDHKGSAASMVQRYAIVMNACCGRVDDFTDSACIRALDELKTGQYAQVGKDIEQCYLTIQKEEAMPSGNSNQSVSVLEHVLVYLRDTIDNLNQRKPVMQIGHYNEETKEIGKTEFYTLEKLANDFDKVIRKGNMFGPRFYEMIYQHHAQIRRKVKLNTQGDSRVRNGGA